jgi:replicative DNA helicase
MSAVWETGVRPVLRLTLASGRQITATANHPLLTVGGWTPVDALSTGDSVAVRRQPGDPDHATVPGDVGHATVPCGVWDHIHKAMREHGLTTRTIADHLGLTHRGDILDQQAISRDRLARLAAVLPDPHLAALATSDVDWEEVVAVDAVGKQMVYDAHVPGTHSFIANDVISHNSGAIEQDSDMVILLHRDDAYEKESLRPGEADLIVAKHRNGPTKDVVVAFQGHYSRFVDMAHG